MSFSFSSFFGSFKENSPLISREIFVIGDELSFSRSDSFSIKGDFVEKFYSLPLLLPIQLFPLRHWLEWLWLALQE